MPAGRPRIADELKKQKGTFQPSRSSKKWVDPPNIDALPDPPDFLDAVGRQEWLEKVDMLDRMKMLKKVDLGLLAALCKEFQNYVAAEKKLDDNARYYSVKDESGRVKYWGLHPAHTVAQQHLKSYTQLCNEFGFSPASRSKIASPSVDKPISKAAEFLKKAV